MKVGEVSVDYTVLALECNSVSAKNIWNASGDLTLKAVQMSNVSTEQYVSTAAGTEHSAESKEINRF